VFQSSPGTQAGCYPQFDLDDVDMLEFQSSPGTQAGCYRMATC
jgi:hypothetical protein